MGLILQATLVFIQSYVPNELAGELRSCVSWNLKAPAKTSSSFKYLNSDSKAEILEKGRQTARACLASQEDERKTRP